VNSPNGTAQRPLPTDHLYLQMLHWRVINSLPLLANRAGFPGCELSSAGGVARRPIVSE